MARKIKVRRVCRAPKETHFVPENKGVGSTTQKMNLTMEEYETIRLMDYQGLNQAECAEHMDVSRGTVQAVYTQAKQKLARFLVEGMELEITGGDYEFCGTPCSMTACGQVNKKVDSQAAKERGEQKMKIAVTYENGKVFQHFGHTEAFKVYEVEDGKIVASEVVDTNGQGHGALADFLFDGGITTLICGGIGGGARNALAAAGIQLYPGASGDADAQVESFLAGNLNYDPDTMCSHHGADHTCGDHGHDDGHSCGGHGGNGCGHHN